jgi:hypothetical protein
VKTLALDRTEAEIEREAASRHQQIRALRFRDAGIWLGKPEFFPLAVELEQQGLPELLAKYRLEGALLSHWDSVRLSPQEGNQALGRGAEHWPAETYAIWTGLPLLPGEQEPLPGSTPPGPKVRGVRLFPQTHHFQLASWTIGTLCEWCIGYGLSLWLWHVEIDWRDVHALAREFPRLPIVVETQWQKILYHDRDLFSLCRACPNILIESSNLIGQDFVTYCVKNLGAERLLFASFLPVNDPYAAMGMILDADISQEQQALIAGGNLRRLLAAAKLP